jgi:hypothetical protein
MNEFPPLERRYRRLLACYPRSFRRENGEEILAVLLACAQDGQRRPGFAASADLIRGAVRMRLRLAGQPPRAVQTAIRLMYAGAAAQLATLITLVVTAGQVHRAVARRYPGLAEAQHAINIHLLSDYIGVAVGIAVWLWLTRALVRGRARARIVLAVDLGLMSLSLLSGMAQGSVTYAPADVIAGAATWLIALAATVFLFTGASSRYYRPGPRPVTPWRGTFGTM